MIVLPGLGSVERVEVMVEKKDSHRRRTGRYRKQVVWIARPLDAPESRWLKRSLALDALKPDHYSREGDA
jgi:hypothetical protein